MDGAVARIRLGEQDHAILCTVHATRGTDAVPVVYALHDDHLGIPIDRVKPKASMRLQRERNLEADPRATLLIEHWNRDDWSQLWWVRAELRWDATPDPAMSEALAAELAARYVQYHDRPFESVLVFHITAIIGWSGE
jgi:PPOX class probable F420-dependent enzyme